MGWVLKDAKCITEEVEPGKFIRKCQTTEELLQVCLESPNEVVPLDILVSGSIPLQRGSIDIVDANHHKKVMQKMTDSYTEAIESVVSTCTGVVKKSNHEQEVTRHLGIASKMKNQYMEAFKEMANFFDYVDAHTKRTKDK